MASPAFWLKSRCTYRRALAQAGQCSTMTVSRAEGGMARVASAPQDRQRPWPSSPHPASPPQAGQENAISGPRLPSATLRAMTAQDIRDEVDGWSAGRSWLWRAPILVGLGWIGVRHLAD